MGGGPIPAASSHLSPIQDTDRPVIGRSPRSIQAPSSPFPPQQLTLAKLLFSKSGVCVHPTSYARDNISGFVALSEIQQPHQILLSWLPESLAKKNLDYEAFLRVSSGTINTNATKNDHEPEEAGWGDEGEYVFVNPSGIGYDPSSYALSIPLREIYSMVVYEPGATTGKVWGSLTVNLLGGTTLPTLHFHSNSSPSSSITSDASFPPPSPPLWPGAALLSELQKHAVLLRSSLAPNLYLVDPNRSDREVHSASWGEEGTNNEHEDPVPPSRRPKKVHRKTSSLSLSTNLGAPAPTLRIPSGSKTANPRPVSSQLLTGFSHLTRFTTNLLSPHLPQPLRSLIHANEPEWSRPSSTSGIGEYDSAKIYLARWARAVAEEGERGRRAEISGVAGEEGGLGVWEVLRATRGLGTVHTTRELGRPVTRSEWEAWRTGKVNKGKKAEVGLGVVSPHLPESVEVSEDPLQSSNLSEKEMRAEVFRRGVEDEIRPDVWMVLLGCVPWKGDTEGEGWKKKVALYETLRKSWESNEELLATDKIKEELHRIAVDCRRTDRSQEMFKMSPSEEADSLDTPTVTNPNVKELGNILLTYVIFEQELGYVQGMSDLCSPLYVMYDGDGPKTFWAFVGIMERMNNNFLRDQSGMKRQLLLLQELIAVMDPELYGYLEHLFTLNLHLCCVNPEKTESLNLFFCFRWILIAFKREFEFGEIHRLWETLFTDHRGPNFLLFIALAVLHSHRDVLLRYLSEFDEILKYCNDLSGCIELDSTLAQADVLYISFEALIRDIDRRQAARNASASADAGGLRQRTAPTSLSEAVLPTPPNQDSLEDLDVPNLPKVSDGLRGLLAEP